MSGRAENLQFVGQLIESALIGSGLFGRKLGTSGATTWDQGASRPSMGLRDCVGAVVRRFVWALMMTGVRNMKYVKNAVMLVLCLVVTVFSCGGGAT